MQLLCLRNGIEFYTTTLLIESLMFWLPLTLYQCVCVLKFLQYSFFNFDDDGVVEDVIMMFLDDKIFRCNAVCCSLRKSFNLLFFLPCIIIIERLAFGCGSFFLLLREFYVCCFRVGCLLLYLVYDPWVLFCVVLLLLLLLLLIAGY